MAQKNDLNEKLKQRLKSEYDTLNEKKRNCYDKCKHLNGEEFANCFKRCDLTDLEIKKMG